MRGFTKFVLFTLGAGAVVLWRSQQARNKASDALSAAKDTFRDVQASLPVNTPGSDSSAPPATTTTLSLTAPTAGIADGRDAASRAAPAATSSDNESAAPIAQAVDGAEKGSPTSDSVADSMPDADEGTAVEDSVSGKSQPATTTNLSQTAPTAGIATGGNIADDRTIQSIEGLEGDSTTFDVVEDSQDAQALAAGQAADANDAAGGDEDVLPMGDEEDDLPIATGGNIADDRTIQSIEGLEGDSTTFDVVEDSEDAQALAAGQAADAGGDEDAVAANHAEGADATLGSDEDSSAQPVFRALDADVDTHAEAASDGEHSDTSSAATTDETNAVSFGDLEQADSTPSDAPVDDVLDVPGVETSAPAVEPEFFRIGDDPDAGQLEADGDDRIVTDRVRSKLGRELRADHLARLNINTQEGGVVYLRGVVDSQEQSDQIEQIVGQIRGVGDIVNELTIEPQSQAE